MSGEYRYSPARATYQIAFGYHHDWINPILARLDPARYQVTVAPLDALDLDRFIAVLPLEISHYAELSRGTQLERRNYIMPKPSVVALCDDKLALANRLCALGYNRHVPAIYADAPQMPYVIKPRIGGYGAGCHMVLRPEDIPHAAVPETHFCQSVVAGEEEFALHLLRYKGEIHFARAVRYVMPGPAEVRSAACKPIKAEFVGTQDVLALFSRVVEDLDYSGTCCFNYKFLGGVPQIIEINPRFGASLTSDLPNYVEAYIAALAG